MPIDQDNHVGFEVVVGEDGFDQTLGEPVGFGKLGFERAGFAASEQFAAVGKLVVPKLAGVVEDSGCSVTEVAFEFTGYGPEVEMLAEIEDRGFQSVLGKG